MTCPECDTIMHIDSKGICACVSCGYKYDQSNGKAIYSNKGILQGKAPTLTPVVNEVGETVQSTGATLEQRGNRYGDFNQHAKLSQEFKRLFNQHVSEYGNPEDFTDTISESIEMIFHKLARIANGDPTYDDNYRDIAGYAELVVQDLNEK